MTDHQGTKGYIITLDTLKGYLATLGPDEEAGLTGNAFECPVARAGKHQYGVEFVVTLEYYYPRLPAGEYHTQITYASPDVAQAIDSIDRITGHDRSVTRREVEQVLGGILV